MKNIIILLFFIAFLFVSCAERYSTRKRGAVRNVSSPPAKNVKITTKNSKKIQSKSPKKQVETISSTNNQQYKVVNQAMSYLGTPYRHGGTTAKGFDCSGFVCASFKPLNIWLHRSSSEMANQGKSIDLKEIQIGDLLFFATGRSKQISHVGIVVETGDDIKFIHSSTSKGVIISSLNDNYWSKAYRKAKRVIM